MGISISELKLNEFRGIFARVKQDFAPGEYPPYFVLRSQLKNGVQKGLLLVDGEKSLGYAVCAVNAQNGYVLISLLSVFAEYRNQGLGTIFLEELKKKYGDGNGIIVEVEKPEEAETEEERVVRTKRMEFYFRAGFRQIPGISYSIWDIPMHLIVCSGSQPEQKLRAEIGPVMTDIYLRLMGKAFIHKMQFRLLN